MAKIFSRSCCTNINQLLDEVENDTGIMNYQSRGLCYMPKPKTEADNSDTRFMLLKTGSLYNAIEGI